ncbi:MAG: S8 family peptidase, partial [bacterium]
MKKLVPYAALVCVLSACSDVPSSTAPLTPAPIVPLSAARSEQGVPVPGQYIVRFRDNEPNALSRAQAIERSHGAVIERIYTSAIKGAAMQLADAAAIALRSDANVLSVEQDQTVSISTTQTNPPSWGLDRIDQHALPLSASYTYAGNGAGVTVYIIDTGINYGHTEFGGRAVPGIDEVTLGGGAVDCAGHGTHVSGTIGGTSYGVAKGVSLVGVRVLDCSGSGTVSGVIAGVDWVTAHKTLPAAANMSLGGSFSATLNQAVANSIAAGVVYGVAAGNSSGNACLESPSSTSTAIVVGATDITDHFASFSNFGTCVHINAPGVNIKSSWIGSTTATNTISGTSMATPHVVGAAALYLQANPSATPSQVKSALTSNATSGVIIGVPASTPNLLLYTGFIGAGTNVAPVARYTITCPTLQCTAD